MKKPKPLSLQFIWEYRIKLRAEGDKFRTEGVKLWTKGNKHQPEGNKLWAKNNKLRAEGDKLRAECDKLYAEGDKLWTEAILATYGNIKMEWKNYSSEKQDYECHLENGEVFKP